MDWNSIETLPNDYEDVIFTDGKRWWAGYVGDKYDYFADKRIYPIWISGDDIIQGVTYWARVGDLPF